MTLIYLLRHGATAQNEQRPIVLQGCGINGPLSETGQAQATAVARVLAPCTTARQHDSSPTGLLNSPPSQGGVGGGSSRAANDRPLTRLAPLADLSTPGERGFSNIAPLSVHHSQLAAVYASPLLRAQQTAAAVAELHGLDVQTLADIHEVDVGEWEGLSWTEVMQRYPEQYQRFVARPAEVPYLGGESYSDVLQRAKPAISEVAARHTGESIVIVAHNVVNRSLLAHLLGLDLNLAPKLRQSNCCINVLRYKDELLEVVTMNAELSLFAQSRET